MVSKQALQVQEDHEAWPQWTWRRAASHHLLIFSMLSGSLSALGGLYGQQSATHASQQLSEQLRALVSPAPPGSSAQTSDDVIEIRNTEPERLHSVLTPNLWRVSPYGVHMCFIACCVWKDSFIPADSLLHLAFQPLRIFYNVLEIKDLWKDKSVAMLWMIY